MAFNWSSLVKRLYVYTTGFRELEIPGGNLKWNRFPLFPECQNVDFLDNFDFQNYTSLIIALELNKIENTGITLHIQERNKEVFINYNGRSIKYTSVCFRFRL